MDTLNKTIDFAVDKIKNAKESLTQELIYENINHWMGEVFEALIAVFILNLITSQINFNTQKIIKVALIIGTLTYFIELYDTKFHSSIKSGLASNIGTKIITGMK
jgi:hypothetical protein